MDCESAIEDYVDSQVSSLHDDNSSIVDVSMQLAEEYSYLTDQDGCNSICSPSDYDSSQEEEVELISLSEKYFNNDNDNIYES